MAAAVYLCGYAGARWSHVIVHRQGFRDGDRVGAHYVVEGDLGPREPVSALTLWAITLAYTPLRAAEWVTWHALRPVESPWPDRPRRP